MSFTAAGTVPDSDRIPFYATNEFRCITKTMQK